MADASPTRWHLAHTTWFFETFILRAVDPHYISPNDQFEYLFNSYYNSVGQQYPRHLRGLLSRPTLSEVWDYRREIDDRIERWLGSGPDAQQWSEISAVLHLGIQHEQQHQELMLTDIKHVFSRNPLMPVYADFPDAQQSHRQSPIGSVVHPDAGQASADDRAMLQDLNFFPLPGGIHSIGSQGHGFCYDNETPRHEVLLQDCELAGRLITNGEYLTFIEQGGYRSPSHWLSAGWGTVQAENWQAPLYWLHRDDGWHEFTLNGLCPLDLNQPVCHLSFFEADAFARWADARLPTEAEWEVFAARYEHQAHAYGSFSEDRVWHPQAVTGASDDNGPRQLFGDCWQWTASQYLGYPGYRPAAGAIGEYNGKFMCNQFVLRGGSVATPRNHIRPTYRNFFPPEARWQFSGLRLAR